MTWTTYESPLGPLTLLGSSAGLAHVRFPGRAPGLPEDDCHTAALAEAVAQLERLGEVARRDLHLVAVGAQGVDDRPQHQHVRRVGEVDPDPHRPTPARRGSPR